MNAQLGMAVLINWIRREMAEGNPLLGLARLNEYTESDSPIRKAMLINFSVTDAEYNKRAAVQKLIHGYRLSDLTEDEQNEVKQFKKSVSIRTNRSIPSNIHSRLLSKKSASYSRRGFRASKRVSSLS